MAFDAGNRAAIMVARPDEAASLGLVAHQVAQVRVTVTFLVGLVGESSKPGSRVDPNPRVVRHHAQVPGPVPVGSATVATFRTSLWTRRSRARGGPATVSLPGSAQRLVPR
jgi:hypothetical protein